LELQNAELLKLLRARGATIATSRSSVDGAATRREFQETSQMRRCQGVQLVATDFRKETVYDYR
jgi:hypothetical protein